MTRAVLRFATHRISRDLGETVAASATCRTEGCGRLTGPVEDASAVEVACMEHTGRAGHQGFTRRFEDVAVVERIEGP
ncbi:DUF7848 domain-containing protein [Streptomyces sp. IBSNAI002]|uniref:DUF7848 domain-containing protein n=1 Tax=Streptomyces sp. IBSNAI002 TaxID=3457500 RepID=UPI003FD33355